MRFRLFQLSVLWFWTTLIGVSYIGLSYIVHSPFQRLLAYFMLAQVTTNWFCTKLVSTTYKPSPNDRKKNWTNNSEVLYIVECDKIAYPYWSWKPCLICGMHRPPRCHHCPLCSCCILKRSHHCFITDCCIGLRNQRFFIVFTFWCAIGCTFCLLHATAYAYCDFVPRFGISQLFLPTVIIRWLRGDGTPSLNVAMVSLLYSVICFFIFSLSSFIQQMTCALCGQTAFELQNNIKVVKTDCHNNLNGVFGKKWWINFIFPAHFLYECSDDGIN